jgi:hypothetical protein
MHGGRRGGGRRTPGRTRHEDDDVWDDGNRPSELTPISVVQFVDLPLAEFSAAVLQDLQKLTKRMEKLQTVICRIHETVQAYELGLVDVDTTEPA